MNAYLRLFRFGNGLMGILGVIIGAFLASGTGLVDYVWNLVIASAVVISFMAGGNALNDYIDREIDKVGHPERPLPRGEITPRAALVCGVGGLALACAISVLMGSFVSTAVVTGAAILMVTYEVYLKKTGFLGNLEIAILTGMLFLYGGAAVNNIEGNLIFAAMAMLVSVGREIAKDIEDMGADEGRKTLPMIVGVKNAGIIASIFYIAGPILSIYPLVAGMFNIMYVLVFLADAIFIYCAIILFKDAHKSQKFAKYAMMVALLAFILGVI